jgi:uncharacterized protein YabE (DUF348 family)
MSITTEPNATSPSDPVGGETRSGRSRATRALLGIGAAAAVGGLAVGGFFALTNTVSLTVDGETSTVYTTADTVSELLDRKDLQTTSRDLVVPGPDGELTDGSEVTVAFARPVDLTIDGQSDRVWTTALSVDDLLGELGVRAGAETSVSRSAGIGRDGLSIEVRTPKDVTVVLVAEQTTEQALTTTALTVGEALADADIATAEGDVVVDGADRPISDGDTVTVNVAWATTSTETVAVPFETEVTKDSSMYVGESTVERAGQQGEATQTVETRYVGTEQTGREVVETTVTREPVNRVVREGTKQRPAAPAVSSGVWDSLARCESGGNWSINTGNGYYGGLQFSYGTWLAYGGGQYAQTANLASREQQIAIATKVRDARGGYGDRPACASKLGLPR